MQRADAPVPGPREVHAASATARSARPFLRPAVAIPVAAALVVAIALADYSTGFEARIAILYLAPVSLATWAAGRHWGFAFAIVSALVWGIRILSPQAHTQGTHLYWDGAVLGVTLALFAEILSRLASALEHSDQRFVRVLEGIDAAVYVIDDEGAILYANRRLAALADDASPLTADATAANFRAHDDRAHPPWRPGAWVDGTELAGRRGNRRYVVQARDIPWVDRPRAYLVVLTDVTDQRIAQELQIDHQEAMHRASRIMALTETTSAVAHELNQPLVAIVGYNAACLRLLEQGGDPAEIRAAMERCRAQAVRAGDILKQLRELTRRRTPEFAPCDLNERVRNALAWTAHDLERAHVAVEVDLAPGLPPVQADRVLIEQVVVNLVQNAIDAMRELPVADRHLRLQTSVDADGTQRVAVSDRGPGIPAGADERLYTSFFTTKADGLGLGLSICRSIVEMHGGRIGHESGRHGGASFHFTVPAGDR